MKKLIICILAILLSSPIFAAVSESDIVKIPLGELELWAITDLKGEMSASLVPDLKKYPEMEKYFKNGTLPSVSRVFFLSTNGRNILFDSGWGKHQKPDAMTLDILKKEGINPGVITDIFLTHLDLDHIGGMIENGKPAFPNATVWISAPEYEAWANGKISGRGDKAINLSKTVLDLYKDKIRLFDFDKKTVQGILALDASGHTPGHTAYEIGSGVNKFIIAGDIAHIAPIQLLRPEMATVYDMDAKKAVEARKNLFDRAARESIPMGGMHLPGMGNFVKNSGNGYSMSENGNL